MKNIALDTYFDESPVLHFWDGENGGLNAISGLLKRVSESINSLFAHQMGCIQQVMVAYAQKSRITHERR
jgi:hypothetical protein